ncbi:MAG TPA: glutamate racemase [Candidatus Paceibacterota bacterium]
MNETRPIGVFDSGVGGLSILRELKKIMPHENYIFVADQLNVPYGEKTQKELENLTLKICKFFVSKNSKLIVAACNTATCHALPYLRSKIKIPIIGTVPAVKPAAEKSKTGAIGIISTPATSQSQYLKNLIQIYAKNLKVANIGCMGLENAVEKGVLNSPEVKKMLNKFIKPIKNSGADIIVLGCTHYPFLKTQIKKTAGTKIKLIDSGKAIAKHTKNTLQKLNILSKSGKNTDFYTTGNPELFSKTASVLLKKNIVGKQIILK